MSKAIARRDLFRMSGRAAVLSIAAASAGVGLSLPEAVTLAGATAAGVAKVVTRPDPLGQRYQQALSAYNRLRSYVDRMDAAMMVSRTRWFERWKAGDLEAPDLAGDENDRQYERFLFARRRMFRHAQQVNALANVMAQRSAA